MKQACAIRGDLLLHEETLRSDLRLERDYRRQLELANSALSAQKQRHQHEGACPICRALEAA